MALGNPLTWLDENVLGGQVAGQTDAQRKAAAHQLGDALHIGDTPGVQTASSLPATTISFRAWAFGFTALAAVLLVSDDDGTWAPAAKGFAWLVVAGLVVTHWSQLTQGVKEVWQ